MFLYLLLFILSFFRISIYFFIIVISISIFSILVNHIRQKQQLKEQRSEESKRKKQSAEENRRKTEEDRREQQERCRKDEEIREAFKRQKQWAEAQQAEENRRKAEELRRKEEELRRQAEEIKKQKERLDAELRQRKEYSSKTFYPRNLRESFEVLGTYSGLTLEEYKKIFKNEVMKYHPDRMKNLGERLQRQAEEEMKAINMAWDIIKKNLS